MSEIINLRQARKQRERDNKHKKSAVRRVAFGTSKSKKNVIELERNTLSKKLDNHKLDTHGEDE